PAQQDVAVFEVDGAESGPIRGTAVAVLHRDVLTYRLQLGNSATIAGQRCVRRAALAREPGSLPVPAERKLGRRGLLGGKCRPVGQARCFLQPVLPFVEVTQTALRQ